jgi:uncharacterized membrane protein
MRTLYIRFMLPIIAILIIATVLVLAPLAMHTAGVMPTSQHNIIAPVKLAKNSGHG